MNSTQLSDVSLKLELTPGRRDELRSPDSDPPTAQTGCGAGLRSAYHAGQFHGRSGTAQAADAASGSGDPDGAAACDAGARIISLAKIALPRRGREPGGVISGPNSAPHDRQRRGNVERE